MEIALAFFGVLVLASVVGHSSVILKKSDLENKNPKLVFLNKKIDLNYKNSLPLGLVIDLRNFSQSQLSNREKTKQRKERIRKRKDKVEKYSQPKNKTQKSPDDFTRNVLRNNEKVFLVRNKTIEILKNGLRILGASDGNPQVGNKSTKLSGNNRLNETLLEKILSSAASKQNVLLSATGIYQLPVGFDIFKTTPLLANNTTALFSEDNKRQNKKHSKSFSSDYDYELVSNFHFDALNDSTALYENIDYETLNADKTIGTLLERKANALKILTNGSSESCPNKNKTAFEDPCQRWLNCRKTLDRAFTRDNNSLPSCPCTYPSSIFYDEMIWDKNQKKYFRWRDASGDAERLEIYKPGAAYCIRSLLTRGSLSVSSQQCCYDRSLQLLTRGSGAGTVNFISPDISKNLHYIVDILPWRLCKGDFTRYNMARYPNNGNGCPENPHEEQYQLQVKLSKKYKTLQQQVEEINLRNEKLAALIVIRNSNYIYCQVTSV